MAAIQNTTPLRTSNRPHLLFMPEVHGWAMERPFVVAAGLTEGMTVLDLGCGDGTRTRLLAAEVGPEGKVIGVDVDEAAIERAKAADADNEGVALEWTSASAYDTGLDDASVDFVIARHIFQHLTDPERALDEISRVLKPGGRICVLDTHDALLWLQPEPDGHAAFMARAAEQQRLRGGDREIGRKLAGLLAGAGFDDVRTDVHVFDTGSLPAELFTALALDPMKAIFPGKDGQMAAAHIGRCADALSDEAAHGSAGFYATVAAKV